MAIIDGRTLQSELDMMYQIGLQKYGLSPDEINRAVLSQNEIVYVPYTITDKVQYLYELFQIAWADGVIQPDEELFLKRYITEFGFDRENVDNIFRELLSRVKSGTDVTDIISELNGSGFE